jgi:endoglucanase
MKAAKIGPAMVLVGLCWATSAPAGAGGPRFPFPQHVQHSAGTILPNHRSQALLDQDVRDAYADWKASFLAQAGTEGDGHPRYRVKVGPAAGDRTVSEGQGYGMLIVALMAGHEPNARTLFDGLWEYFNDHRSSIDNRLMDYSVNADEILDADGNDSAFDGDADIAMGLLLAEQQWGNGGRINYHAEALSVLAGQAESVMGTDSKLPLLGDWVDPAGAQYNQYTVRSSDFMPGHFLNFAHVTGLPIWTESLAAMATAIEDIQQFHSPSTGLLPDFLLRNSAAPPRFQPTGPNFLEGPHDGHYYYNAGRDPWRLASYALLHGDSVSSIQVRKISTWIASSTAGNPQLIRPGYLLDGTPVTTTFFSSFFAAPFAVASMLDPARQSFLNATYDAVRLQREGYYEDSITLLCLLVMSANYWDPIAIGPIHADGFETLPP